MLSAKTIQISSVFHVWSCSNRQIHAPPQSYYGKHYCMHHKTPPPPPPPVSPSTLLLFLQTLLIQVWIFLVLSSSLSGDLPPSPAPLISTSTDWSGCWMEPPCPAHWLHRTNSSSQWWGRSFMEGTMCVESPLPTVFWRETAGSLQKVNKDFMKHACMQLLWKGLAAMHICLCEYMVVISFFLHVTYC